MKKILSIVAVALAFVVSSTAFADPVQKPVPAKSGPARKVLRPRLTVSKGHVKPVKVHPSKKRPRIHARIKVSKPSR